MPKSRRPKSRAVNVARLEHPRLWEKYWRFRSVNARNVLVEALFPRAINFVCKALHVTLRGRRAAARPRSFGLTDDEKAEVVIGLINVVERYDPSLGSLSTYMWWVVNGVVIELWRKQGWFPKGWFLGKPERNINMLSLNKLRDDYESAVNSRSIGSAHQDGWMPSALIDQDSAREIENVVSTHNECLHYLRMLSGLDKLVIQKRYMEDIPFRIIAEQMGVTPQRISFVHKRAIRKLRKLVGKK